MKMPSRRNGVLSAVDACPSAPPSSTCTCAISQFDRLPSTPAPAMTVSAVVVTEQVLPAVESLGVVAHGTVKRNGRSDTVAGSIGDEPLYLSVMRNVSAAWSWPA